MRIFVPTPSVEATSARSELAGEPKETREAAERIELVGMAPLAEQMPVPRYGLVAGGDVNARAGIAIERRRFSLRTRILQAFRHRLAVVQPSERSTMQVYLSAMSPSASARMRSSSRSSPRARSTASTKDVDAAVGGAIADAVASGEDPREVRRARAGHTRKASPIAASSRFRWATSRASSPICSLATRARAVRYLGRRNVKKIAIVLPPEAKGREAACAAFVAEGAITGSFDTTIYQDRPRTSLRDRRSRRPRAPVSTRPKPERGIRAARRSAKP